MSEFDLIDPNCEETVFSWRQGSVVPTNVAAQIGLVSPVDSGIVAIVATHDCDCVADESKEPFLELILGRIVEAQDGSVANAKSTRRLHLTLSNRSRETPKFLEFLAQPKAILKKSDVAKFTPDANLFLERKDLKILASWLRARYERASFPDTFIERLSKVTEKIERSVKNYGEQIHGIYIAHDPDGELDLPTDLYFVEIFVVYDSSISAAPASAEIVAAKIREAFEKVYKVTETSEMGILWSGIELGTCAAIADLEMSLKDLLEFKLYRLDHISLRNAIAPPLSDAA